MNANILLPGATHSRDAAPTPTEQSLLVSSNAGAWRTFSDLFDAVVPEGNVWPPWHWARHANHLRF